MEKSEGQKLADLFAKKAAAGLVDVKFYVAGEVSSEQVCREVNRLYQSVDSEDCAVLDFADRTK